MLPNKIYAGFDKNTHLESYCTEKKGKCQTEYIRKDALLEWAKKEMGEWSSESNTAQGVKMGLTLVLDKIESL